MRHFFWLAALVMGGCLAGYDSSGLPSQSTPAPSTPAAVPPSGMPPSGAPAAPPSDPTPVIPPPTPPSTAGGWVRGSLKVPYQLTPVAEYPRIAQNVQQIFAVQMRDQDFEARSVTTSAAAKLDEIGAQLAAERGLTTAIDLIPDADDRRRSLLIPFRGNPSDVKLVSSSGAIKAFVPLGGDVMTPGDEVAVVTAGVVTRVRVGVRPQRLAVHSSGLIFVCNQYSNYISIIDSASGQLLTKNGSPVEVQSEYFCADLTFKGDTLYVANRWRRSVLAIPLTVSAGSVTQGTTTEITGVGSNPFRLALDETGQALYVANNKGGDLARIDLASAAATARVSLNAPTADVVVVGGSVLVPTTTPYRGLLAAGDPVPPQVAAPPTTVTGLDGQSHTSHPGALFDGTRSYNFEDLRNGLFALDGALATAPTYYTDNVSSEPNFTDDQKILAGALPTTVVRTQAGDRVYVALGGSDRVQELAVAAGVLTATGRVFRTRERPFGLALDEAAQQLYVADWGGEVLERFNLASGAAIDVTDLGYAQPRYPATNIETGEYYYYNAGWSNNGRKACATCHFDELDTDGVGFGNGATAPTAMHQVKPNHNLLTTNSYFWNGSFGDGNYTSLAFAAQTRTNCELIEFGFIEGPASNPFRRIGDPNNRFSDGNDFVCQPQSIGQSELGNQADIDAQVAADKQIAQQEIQNDTGLDVDTLSRFVDFYSVAELRLPPNPLRQLYDAGQLDSATATQVQRGKGVFATAGCVGCHVPSDARHPYTDGLDHGSQADWTQRFVDTYKSDPRVFEQTGVGVPRTMIDGIAADKADHEVNVYSPLDDFEPFCFVLDNCLVFEDPLAVRGDFFEESRRLDLLVKFNLADQDREFIPGNVTGAPKINTPSLRGVWTQANLLRHGLARSVAAAVLAPGHPALPTGATGWAVDRNGQMDVHGTTSKLTADDVAALVQFVDSIE